MKAQSAIAIEHDAVHPPLGFRGKASTLVEKLQICLNQDGRCAHCGERLGHVSNIEYDHIPALQLRLWDVEAKETIPRSNDIASLFAKHKDCHAAKTTGRRGTSKLSKVGGDQSEIAKTRRLSKEQEEFRRSLLRKDQPDTDQEARPKPKHQWPKRKMPTRRK